MGPEEADPWYGQRWQVRAALGGAGLPVSAAARRYMALATESHGTSVTGHLPREPPASLEVMPVAEALAPCPSSHSLHAHLPTWRLGEAPAVRRRCSASREPSVCLSPQFQALHYPF